MGVIADVAFIGGRVLTLDAAGTVAEAVAVRRGAVLAVGDTSHVRDVIGPSTRVVELAGRTVLPGINDSHLHACPFGIGLPPNRLDVRFPASRSIADIRRLVAERVLGLPTGTPVLGVGWDIGYLDECLSDARRLPTRWDLDDVSPDHPVLLQDFSGHASWANSAWLRLAGLTGDEDAPAGGVIGRRDGELSGLFFEGAQILVQSAAPALTDADIESGLFAAVDNLHRLGITSYTDPGIGPGAENLLGGARGSRVLDRYVALARAGTFDARVSVLWLPCSMTASSAQMRRNLTDAHVPGDVDVRRLRLVGAKIYGDGIPPNKTAWMHDEYTDGGHGALCVHGDSPHEQAIELAELIRLVDAAGLQAGVHVTGDAAIDLTVDSFVKASRSSGNRGLRHYVIHGDFVSDESLHTLAAHGFGLNMQPAIKWTISDLMDDMVGEQRSSRQWPVRSALAAGVDVSASSDAPVVEPDWRRGVSAMMLRESKASGRVSGAGETVGLTAALRAYTTTPAKQDFAESWKGSLQRGFVADLCVLGGDLEHTDAHEIPDLPIDMTVFDGRLVHERPA